ncbi:MAG: dethiobiotin synthase [Hydrogenovibrio sp.]|uniref:dethiobiotin synthase n=1 Tax=Hydrogenovibrio sp. TaxID=2065821 RepID=UPI00286FDF4F|nr:dethiobiotin synthase [Hydrogenovibrio sp.]MDR9498421.1 dethiobiotin synthase [Hydrogenovibrio sp.]
MPELPVSLRDWLDSLQQSQERGVFVTGTDTDVGKTYVSARLLSYLSQSKRPLAPRKPVASGCERGPDGQLISEDVRQLYLASRKQTPMHTIGPNLYQPAISPARAIAQAGDDLNLTDLLRACEVDAAASAKPLLWVEGAGGFYSPLTADTLNADLAKALGLPVLLVVGNRLGCLNHARLTLEAIARHRLPLAGVVLNDTHSDADPENEMDLIDILPDKVPFAHLPYSPEPVFQT